MCKLGAAVHYRDKRLIITLVGLIRRGKGRCFRKICKFSWCSLVIFLTSAHIVMINVEFKPFAHYTNLYFKSEYRVCVQKLNFTFGSCLRIFVHLFLMIYLLFSFLQGIWVLGWREKIFFRCYMVDKNSWI